MKINHNHAVIACAAVFSAILAGCSASHPDGKNLYEHGLTSKDVPVCASCHGTRALGNSLKSIPPLAGKPAKSLRSAMLRLADKKTGFSGVGHLSLLEIDAITGYLSSLPSATTRHQEHLIEKRKPHHLALYGQYGALVGLGKKIFNDTPRYAGQYTGNDLSCANCHLGGGTKADSAPMWGAVGMYPRYQSKSHRVVSFAQRLQQCFIFSENGYAPPINSQTILALSAYAHYLSRGRALGVIQKGSGFAALPTTEHDGDPVSGRHVYDQKCIACHGADGKGKRVNGRVVFPALWGLDSFARGAGMSREHVAARFIWKNMPFGGPYMSAQQAKDVASYIDSQIRPPDPRKGVFGWLK